MDRFLRVLVGPAVIVALWLSAAGFFGTAHVLTAGRRPRLEDEVTFAVAFAVASAIATVVTLAIGGYRRRALEAAVPMTALLALPVVVGGILSWLAPAMGWTLMNVSGFPRYKRLITAAIWETAKLTVPSGVILGALSGSVAGVVLLLAHRRPRLAGWLMAATLLACIAGSFHIEAFGRVTDLVLEVRLAGVRRVDHRLGACGGARSHRRGCRRCDRRERGRAARRECPRGVISVAAFAAQNDDRSSVSRWRFPVLDVVKLFVRATKRPPRLARRLVGGRVSRPPTNGDYFKTWGTSKRETP
jgi:hypothetical protein